MNTGKRMTQPLSWTHAALLGTCILCCEISHPIQDLSLSLVKVVRRRARPRPSSSQTSLKFTDTDNLNSMVMETSQPLCPAIFRFRLTSQRTRNVIPALLNLSKVSS
ncbi:hypothetical protein BDR04DRAFT_507486 [Suillus decipiens]|nr:hypothetical protein BDR04DRAFT_507486 [Suillus decipiens]